MAEGIDERTDPDVENLVFRLVQEALTNVAKHARAPLVRIHLRRAGARLFLRVEDRGAGFDAAEFLRSTDEERGFGLRGMRDRVHLFAGRFAVSSQPGAGTTLEIEVPLEHRREGAGLMSRLRILLADDHTIVRQGLVSILKAVEEFEVVAEAADGSEAVDKALATRPDVVVLDVTMPRLNGLEAARRIHKALPGEPHPGPHHARGRGVRPQDGARGGVRLSGQGRRRLRARDRDTRPARGQGVFRPAGLQGPGRGYQGNKPVAEDPYSRLTDREREVFQLLVEGRTNAQVADILCISSKTVDNHRTHLMEKLGVHSAVELLRFAAKHGHLS